MVIAVVTLNETSGLVRNTFNDFDSLVLMRVPNCADIFQFQTKPLQAGNLCRLKPIGISKTLFVQSQQDAHIPNSDAHNSLHVCGLSLILMRPTNERNAKKLPRLAISNTKIANLSTIH